MLNIISYDTYTLHRMYDYKLSPFFFSFLFPQPMLIPKQGKCYFILTLPSAVFVFMCLKNLSIRLADTEKGPLDSQETAFLVCLCFVHFFCLIKIQGKLGQDLCNFTQVGGIIINYNSLILKIVLEVSVKMSYFNNRIF